MSRRKKSIYRQKNLNSKVINKKLKNAFFVIVILLTLGLVLKSYYLKSYNNELLDSAPNIICEHELENYKTDLLDCKKENEIRLNNDRLSEQYIDDLEDDTKYRSSSKRCKKDPDIWLYLPKELKYKTYRDNVVSAGSATYDIFPLNWSADCKILPFLLELLGRGGDAYTSEDFIPRGLYFFNDENNKIEPIFLVTERDMYIDNSERSTNYWTQNKYIFIVSTDDDKKIFVKKRYEYDVELGAVSHYGE